jgi:lysine 2,3-aminomutase
MRERAIASADQLENFLTSNGLTWSDAHLPPREVFDQRFKVRFPLFYARLINWRDEHDPLKKMVVPSEEEFLVQLYEMFDPIGDHTHEPVSGLIHRYPDRCLLLLSTHCVVHCRFCFRRDVIGSPLHVDYKGILKYLAQHQELEEVIFSGGDPAALPVAYLAPLLNAINELSHIKMVRFHTRELVVDPTAIQQDWLREIYSLQKQKVVVLHVNHPREITPELVRIIKELRKNEVSVLSQSVFLKGVNDSLDTLKELFVHLATVGIQPYYLHHLDEARGTHHFRISIEKGKQIFMQLRGSIPGYCVPEYVLDLPGGDGKVPVMWLQEIKPGTYSVTNFEGRRVIYTDPSFSAQ